MRRTKICHPPRIYLASPARPPAAGRGPSLERPPRHQPPLLLAPFLGGAASGSLPTVTPQRGLPPRHISPVPPIASQGGVPPPPCHLQRPPSAAPPANTPSLGGVQPEIHRRARFLMLNVDIALTAFRITFEVFSWTDSKAVTKVMPLCGALS
nr:classical arabinogalactan protein 9-like [Aegilops tauschii subsp. strangulata]